MKWYNWIIEGLPPRRRTVRIFTLCVILLHPVRILYDEFTAWKNRMWIKAGATPQVCMLKKIVRDELGIDVVIEEGNGKPIDFTIKTAFTDTDKERQLFALLDRYKLAGKSYAYENAEITFESNWTQFVCEKKILNNIIVTYHWRNDPAFGNVVYKMTIQADAPVRSSLEILLEFIVYGTTETNTVRIPFGVGETFMEFTTFVIAAHISESIIPAFDNYFNYVLKVVDEYE